MAVIVITPGTQIEVVVCWRNKSVEVPVTSVAEAERWVNNLRSIGIMSSYRFVTPD